MGSLPASDVPGTVTAHDGPTMPGMSAIRSRVALAGAAITLAVGSATGAALIAGGPADAASAKTAAKAHKGNGKGPKALRKVIRTAIKDAKGGDKKRLSPEALRDAIAPAVKQAVADGKVNQKAVDRRAERARAIADALGG
jgi:hypothetical protein